MVVSVTCLLLPTASEDYEPISDHVLVFNATILTHNVTITILEDDIREEMEMFSLSLTSQSNATTDTDMMGSHFEIPLGILGVLIIGKKTRRPHFCSTGLS